MSDHDMSNHNMSEYENALRAAATLKVQTKPPPYIPRALYAGPYLDIRYTVCPESAVASRCKTLCSIDIQRLRALHQEKWFERLLFQLDWKFGNPSTHDMSIHVAGVGCNGAPLTAADFEMSSGDTLGSHVFHIHFAKRPAPPPEPIRPYEFDVEEEELIPLPSQSSRARWAPAPGQPYPYPGDLEK